jgi:hypothetical protein
MNSAEDRQGSPAVAIEALVRRAVCCPCPRPRRIAIRYGSGSQGESRARALHAQLRASRPDILVSLHQDAYETPDGSHSHFCATFDSTQDRVVENRAPAGQSGKEHEPRST